MARATGSLCCVGSTPRLVPGRLRELEALQAQRHRSAQGELRVALVLGDAGLGKTQLAAELLPRDDDPAVGLITRSSPLGGMPLLGPWADALGLHTDDRDAEGVCRACGSGLGGLPALVRRAEIAHDASSCAQALRYHFVEWIPGLLAKASADRPIVVVLDDVHHGHDAIWEMLLRLAWDFPASRLFVLATARPAELARNRMAVTVLHALDQEAMVCRIQLAPFSRQDVQELATGIIGPDRVPSALVDCLVARARGNPRCTVGLLEALADDSADLQAPALGGVPEKLARWVRAEAARLDPPALALVEVLAVVGTLVDAGDLAHITGQPIEDVALTLEWLVRCGMVVEQQHDRFLGYHIAHPLTQEVLYTDIGGARRRVLHRRAADTLLKSGRTGAAAHYVHAAQAGDGEAIDALIEMIQRGLCSQVWTTVSTLRELLPIGDERWLRVFDASFQRSNWGVVDRTEHHVVEAATVGRMRELLAGIGDLQRQADIRLWLAGLFAFGAGDLDAAQRECRQARELYERTGDRPAALIAAIELAAMRGWAGDLRGAELAARQFLLEAQQGGEQRAIAEALGALGHTLGWQGRFEAAEDVLLRSVELAVAAGRVSWMSQSLALLASLDACRGHLASARTRWAQAAAASPHYDPMIGSCGAFIELLNGDLAMVAAHARRAQGHDPAARSGLPARLAAWAAMAAAERGRLTEARRHLDAITRTDGSALGVLQPWCWWAEGVVARTECRLDAATTVLQRAVDGYSAMSLWALTGFVLADLAEVAVAAGDSDAAARAAALADDDARRTGTPIHQALHQFVVAWARIGRGHHGQATRAALRAIDGFGSSGYPLLAARARIAYAIAARRSDPRAAGDAVREAIKAFDACDAVLRGEQARTLLIQIRSDSQCTTATARGPGALTGRERQVVKLAAGGYTAPQIATRLHIGVRTVETHLARSYPKLGVTSKKQLVCRAAEFELMLGP